MAFSKLSSPAVIAEIIPTPKYNYSSRLINYVEKVNVGGIFKTKFYSEINTNLNVGDKIYIIGGNYDNTYISTKKKTRKGANGYTILSIDNCSIVLDIDWVDNKPVFNIDDYDNYIKLFSCKDSTELSYWNNSVVSNYIGGPYSTVNKFFDNLNNVLYISSPNIQFTLYVTSSYTQSVVGYHKIIGGYWTNISYDYSINNIPGLGINNDKIFVVESNNYGSNFYKNGNILTYNNGWVLDNNSVIPLISKNSFRNGVFKQGSFNDGIFGVHNIKNIWTGTGSVWNNGILLNSDWNNGIMSSKSDNVFGQKTYFTKLENGIPKQSIDTNNNTGNGYNYIINSNFYNGNIHNGNIYDSYLSSSTTYSVMLSDIQSTTFSSSLSISGGSYNNSKINGLSINNSKIYDSSVDNSSINNSRIYNSTFDRSVTQKSEWYSNGLKIRAYDIFNYYNTTNTFIISKKLYLGMEDWLRLSRTDNINFRDVIMNTVLPKSEWDEFINNNHINQFFYLSSISENSIKTDMLFDGVNYSNNAYSNDNLLPSLDINYIIDISLDATPTQTYFGLDKNLSDYVKDITNSYILKSNYNSGIFRNSIWKSGNHNNENVISRISIKPSSTYIPTNLDIKLAGTASNYGLSMSFATQSYINLTNTTTILNNQRRPNINDLVYIKDTYYFDGTFSGTQSIDGWYKIKSQKSKNVNYTGGIFNTEVRSNIEVLLEPVTGYLYTTTHSISATESLYFDSNGAGYLNAGTNSTYEDVYFDTTLFKDSTFESGVISQSILYNNIFYNKDIILSNDDLDQLNINKLKLISHRYNETNTISNAFIYNSLVDSINWNNGIIYDSIWRGSTFSNGLSKSVWWMNGIFNNGRFVESDGIIFDNGISVSGSQKTLIINKTSSNIVFGDWNKRWDDGQLNGGLFYKSSMLGGDINGGQLYNMYVVPYNRTININGGIFGKSNLDKEKSLIATNDVKSNHPSIVDYNITVNYATSENAVWDGHIVWNNGIFNGGVIRGIRMNNGGGGLNVRPPEWYGGVFNGGDFSGASIWYNGTFNGGRFTSVTDHYNAGYYGEHSGFDNYIDNYSWRDGVFNGGTFGDEDKYIYEMLDVFNPGYYDMKRKYKSSWYTGKFTGGKFIGRIWNDGIFVGGTFEGSITQSTTTKYYEAFEQYTQSSTQSWYGVWRQGIVTNNPKKSTNLNFSELKLSKAYTKNEKISLFKNMVWLDGQFDNTLAVVNNSIWMKGNFNSGNFNNSYFNPYIKRWDFTNWTGAEEWQYELGSASVWNNGVLDNSYFDISEWNDGLFKNGTMSASKFNKGTSNYMNAYNVIWDGGRWRNGNWYGSNYILAATPSTSNFTVQYPENSYQFVDYNPPSTTVGLKAGQWKDQLVNNMLRNGTSSIHIWDVFTASNYHTIHNTEIIPVGTLTNSISSSVVNTIPVSGYNSTFDIHTFATYSNFKYTSGNNILYTKIGNGQFRKGVWETGVWNNGERKESAFGYSDTYKLFNTVEASYKIDDNTWQVILKTDSVTGLKVGDDVSIGNISLIDINGDRIAYRDKSKVLSVTTDTIYFNLTTKFPLRAIVKDSDFHRIYVSKNIWLNGVFLNGNFSGVWNNGMVKSYRRLASFKDTHWIDGTFDGGYINSIYKTYSAGTYSTSVIQYGTVKENSTQVTPLLGSPYYRFETHLDFIYDKREYSRLQDFYVNSTTEDILSMKYYSNNYKYLNDSTGYEVLHYGTKFKRYDNVILDKNSSFDLLNANTNIYDLGYTFSFGEVYNIIENSSLNNYLHFNSTASSPSVGALSHVNKQNIPRGRYAETSFKVINYSSNIAGPSSGTPNGLSPDFNTSLMGIQLVGGNSSNSLYKVGETAMYYDYNYSNHITLGLGDLGLLMVGNLFSGSIDDFKYTEVDRIPFHYYTASFGITSPVFSDIVNIPYSAISPFIDFKDNEYVFAGGVKFNFDTIVLQPTNLPINQLSNIQIQSQSQ